MGTGAAAAALGDGRTAAVGPRRRTDGRPAIVTAAHAVGPGFLRLTVPLTGPERRRVLSGVHGLAGRKNHDAHDLHPSLCRRWNGGEGA